MTPEAIDQAARLLAAGRTEGAVLGALPVECRPEDEAAAYAVQMRLHELLTAAGLGSVAGHKIGCTTPVMQAFLNIHNPCAGGVLASSVRHQEGVFRHASFRHVGVECEIAVRLGAPLMPAGAPYTAETVAPAVHAVMAGIEVVDDRYDDYGQLGAPTLIADDFFDAGCVLGPPVTDWHGLDLTALGGRMAINGQEVGSGRGADIMGHPFVALAWLANEMARRGTGLATGDFVFLGSVVETKWVEAGDRVDIELDQLGAATALFR